MRKARTELRHRLILALSACLIPAGCGQAPPIPAASGRLENQATPAPEPMPRATDRAANLQGDVLIVEYHKIAAAEARWDRSRARFRADLERFYKMGFRPVTVGQYLDGNMPLPPGASPIVFTFDDSHPSQFRLLKDGSVDPDCAVGIWRSFAEKHPDFPVRATFYVLPPTPWGQPKQLAAKYALLKEWGCELGSHTVTHTSLKKLDAEGVKRELAGAIDFIEAAGFRCRTIALPYGIAPKDERLLRAFEYRGKRYAMEGALLVGANPARSPSASARDAFRLPRIQGIEGDMGITYWLDRVEQGGVRPYVAK
ncbi:MAG: polysaccharide deacetylase family protein [Fimbriimonadaceae bacterium]|nr:polysaccharide deacetylase family protein [Fimbriimonadaceae bacterium]